MKIIEGKIYLTWEELQVYGYTTNFLRKVCHEYRNGNRSSYANIPDSEDKRVCLVSYDSIPQASRIEKEMPSKEELISEGFLKSQLQKDPMAYDFYLSNPHTAGKARQYQSIASYLMLAAPTTVTAARSIGFANVDAFYEVIMKMMLSERFDIWQLTNLDRFKRKLSPFKSLVKDPKNKGLYEKALGSLISKKYGQKNAAKVVANDNQAEEIQATLIKIYADPRKFSIQDTHLVYIKIAKQKYELFQATEGKEGWDAKCMITEQTITNFLYEPSIQQVWYLPRHGEKEYRNVFERNTKRIAATYANAKWVIDGTPLHRYFLNGDSAFNRVHVFFVMDECTWCILGVGISLTGESSGQIIQAIRAATQNAGLFAGKDQLYAPFQIQSDNSSANKSYHVTNAVEIIGAINTPARVGNSKSKRAEPLNKHFFARWMKYREGFTGSMGMSTAINNKVNEEHLTKSVQKKQLPSLTTTLNQLQEDVNNWNNDKSWNNSGIPEAERLSPIEKYRSSLIANEEKQKTITDRMSVMAFYWTPTNSKQVKDESSSSREKKTIHIPQTYRYTNSGIKVERISPMDGKKIKMEFDVKDPGFNEKNIGREFIIRIEPLNYDHAYLFIDDKPMTDDKGNWIIAHNKETFHSAVADHNEGEMTKIMQHEQIKKDQKSLSVSRFEFFQTKAMDQVGIEAGDIINPRLFGQKEITDSLKIAQSERLANGSRFDLREPEPIMEEEPEPVTKQPTIKRF